MSRLTYIASDFPLEEMENPHIKLLSVNQALEMGIKVHEFLLEPSYDRDKPNVILWVDDDKNFGEISIRPFCKGDILDDIYTEKKFYAHLEWEYTDYRAEKLIKYIKSHLIDANELELWNIWLGECFDESEPKVKRYYIPIEQLTSSDLEKVFLENYEFLECIVISRPK